MKTNDELVKQNAKKKLQDLYMNIKNCRDLAKWLDYRFANTDHELAFSEVEDNYIYGRLDEPLFCIEMPSRTRMILKVEDWGEDYEHVLGTLKSAIAPTIWHLGGSKASSAYKTDVVAYRFKETNVQYPAWVDVIGYDVKDPKGLVQDILLQAKQGLIKISDLHIAYPNLMAEEVMYDSLFGTYTGFADEKYIKQINKYSEFELFMAIKSLAEQIATYVKNTFSDIENIPDYDETSVRFTYALAYLVQQAKRFGIKVNPPSFEFTDQPIEFDAWVYWWDEAYEDLIRNNPNIMEEWKSYKKGYDPNFRPKTPYKDYLKAYKELRDEEIARIEKENLENKRKEVSNTLNEVKEAKRVENKPKINALKMIDNLIYRSNVSKEQQEFTPYDFI